MQVISREECEHDIRQGCRRKYAGDIRWVQLLVGIVCMVMIANLQYGWTLFVDPIEQGTRMGGRRHPDGFQHFRRRSRLG